MNCFDFNRLIDEFDGLAWNKTMFEDVEWFYAEERRYIVHLKKRPYRPEQFRIVKARNPDEAIAFACFDMEIKRKDKPNGSTTQY